MELKTFLKRTAMSLGQRTERVTDPALRTALLEVAIAVNRALRLL
jgi:hypothetical protein